MTSDSRTNAGVDQVAVFSKMDVLDAPGERVVVALSSGDTLREVVQRDGPALEPARIDPGCNFIVGGQVKGEAPRLFHVYPQGNFIEATRDTPLDDAAKGALVSFHATLRSNVSVGLPIDLLACRRARLRVTVRKRIGEDDEYFGELGRLWTTRRREMLREAPPVLDSITSEGE